jgi:hypothetical protein
MEVRFDGELIHFNWDGYAKTKAPTQEAAVPQRRASYRRECICRTCRRSGTASPTDLSQESDMVPSPGFSAQES